MNINKAQVILYVAHQIRSRDFYAAVLGTEPVLDVPGMTEFELTDDLKLGLMPENGSRRSLPKIRLIAPREAEFHGVSFICTPTTWRDRSIGPSKPGQKKSARFVTATGATRLVISRILTGTSSLSRRLLFDKVGRTNKGEGDQARPYICCALEGICSRQV